MLALHREPCTTRMVCKVKAQQAFNGVRWCNFPAKKSLCGRCGLPSSRNILLTGRCKSGALVSASLSHTQPEVSENELHRRLNKAVGLVNTADLLAPFDRSSYSAPLVIWSAKLRTILAVSVDTHQSS